VPEYKATGVSYPIQLEIQADTSPEFQKELACQRDVRRRKYPVADAARALIAKFPKGAWVADLQKSLDSSHGNSVDQGLFRWAKWKSEEPKFREYESELRMKRILEGLGFVECKDITLPNRSTAPRYQRHYKDAGCRDRGVLDCDFAIEGLRVIECQGLQHYEFVEHFHRTPQGFERQRVRDRRKVDFYGSRLLCVDNRTYDTDVVALVTKFLEA
jgi:hypothetical protein